MKSKWKVVNTCLDTFVVDKESEQCITVLKRSYYDSEKDLQRNAELIALLPEMIDGIREACFSCGRYNKCHKCPVSPLKECLYRLI